MNLREEKDRNIKIMWAKFYKET